MINCLCFTKMPKITTLNLPQCVELRHVSPGGISATLEGICTSYSPLINMKYQILGSAFWWSGDNFPSYALFHHCQKYPYMLTRLFFYTSSHYSSKFSHIKFSPFFHTPNKMLANLNWHASSKERFRIIKQVD